MKDGFNALYDLLDKHNDFMKSEFIMFPKTSLFDTNYCMFVPRSRGKGKISTAIGELTAVSYHITVYEDLNKEVDYSTFHITINLIDDNKKSYVARIYYKDFGTPLFYTIKDKHKAPVSIGADNELLKFGNSSIQQFVEMILSLKQDYDRQYSILEDALHQLRVQPNKLSEYKRELGRIIRYIESGALFNQSYWEQLTYYKNVLEYIENNPEPIAASSNCSTSMSAIELDEKPKPSEEQILDSVSDTAASSSQTVTKVRKKVSVSLKGQTPIHGFNQKIEAVQRSKEIGPIEAVLQEYELQNQKLGLLTKTDSKKGKRGKKSSQTNSDDDLIDTSIRCRQLQIQINKMLLEVLNNDLAYKAIEPLSLSALFQHCTLDTAELLDVIVSKNRSQALVSLMAARSGINLDAKSKKEKRYLLEIAYKKGCWDVFQCLLTQKASPDIECADGRSILYRACLDGRSKEMEALLRAKANPLIKSKLGFSPLAALLMQISVDRINIPMAAVFLTYAPYAIDQLQGAKGEDSTLLAYSCQENRWDVVEMLLQFGADPNKTRADSITVFGVCVYKDNFELFKYLVDNATIPIRDGLINALNLAVLIEKAVFIEYIIQYSEKHHLNLSIPTEMEAKEGLKELAEHSRKAENQKHAKKKQRFFSHSDSDDDCKILEIGENRIYFF